MANVKVGVGLSQEQDTRLAAQNAVRGALHQAGLQGAPWALCFFTGSHLSRADAIRHIVMEETGCSSLCGCSAMGVLGAGQEVERSAGIVVMVGDGAGVESHSMLLPHSGEGLASMRALALCQAGSPLLIALPDSFQVDHARFQERLARDWPAMPVLGAGSTDDGTVGISLQV
ncbi:MAG TPA: FIST N-terminal domain-containing protein, partial [bacterium]|nr:FIST N-terminal domain-containing protein [bacterium]